MSRDHQMGAASNRPSWGIVKSVLFRFAFVYFIVYMLPFPINAMPYVGQVTMHFENARRQVVVWVGATVFDLEITIFPAGSGDTTFNYVQVFCYALMAGAITLVW